MTGELKSLEELHYIATRLKDWMAFQISEDCNRQSFSSDDAWMIQVEWHPLEFLVDRIGVNFGL